MVHHGLEIEEDMKVIKIRMCKECRDIHCWYKGEWFKPTAFCEHPDFYNKRPDLILREVNLNTIPTWYPLPDPVDDCDDFELREI